ncbi:MAG TPA: (d)CMP kinase [Gammaproteobacteria bacterium]|nr:(d)CMP kinase [Gammaproteobacteria bacterium]
MSELPPVIAIDGPGGTGKGTVGELIAKKLGWHYLDSGALYRLLAYAALERRIDLSSEQQLQDLAHHLSIEFIETNGAIKILLSGQDVTFAIRSESCGNAASRIAALSAVRTALLDRQRMFRRWPGLVTDGRDMGTVVFPDAQLKIFLQASLEERAKRRFAQLKSQEVHVSLDAILQDLVQRDTRDKQRGVAPLIPALDAILIDTTELTVEQVFERILQVWSSIKRRPGRESGSS